MRFEKFTQSISIRIFGGTLAKRLVMLLSVGVVLPLCIVMYFTVKSTSDDMAQGYAQENQNSIVYLSKIVDSYYEVLKELPTVFYSQTDVFFSIMNPSSMDNAATNLIFERLKQTAYSRSDIEAIRLYTGGNRAMIVYNRSDHDPNNINKAITEQEIGLHVPYYDKLNPDNKLFISPMSKQKNTDRFQFTVNQLITDFDNKSVLSVLSMDFNFSYLDGQASNLSLSDGGALLILNREHELMYAYGDAQQAPAIMAWLNSGVILDEKGYLRVDMPSGRELIIYCWDKNRQHLMLESIPLSYIYGNVRTRMLKYLPVLACSFVIFIVLIFMTANSMTKPLKKLANSMKSIENGNFDVRINYKTHSAEFSLLIDKFNLMTAEINRLFNDGYKMQIAQKNAELHALQAQINPHFLYNTLQTTQYMAMKRRAYEIEAIVGALSDIMKYCLRDRTYFVELGEELEYVNKYLLIQRFKFINNLEVTLEYPEEAARIHVPRMILQPIIENCFIHGFDNERGVFRVWVICVNRPDCVSIEISDNGRGISGTKLMALQEMLGNVNPDFPYSGEDVGIMNVSTRLKILYKDRYRMNIESIPFEKTTVAILIPYESGS